jgi:hypothetical protein
MKLFLLKIFCIGIIGVTTFQLHAQRKIHKAIESKKYDELLEDLNKELSEKPADVISLYGLGLLYNCPDYAAYDTKLAYSNMLRARNIYGELDDKEKEKLTRKDLVPDSMDTGLQHIIKNMLADNRRVRSLIKAESDVLYYQLLLPEQKKELENLIMELAFSEVKSHNKIANYEGFLLRQPAEKEKKFVNAKLDSLYYEEARTARTTIALENYIRNRPGSSYQNDANRFLIDLKFEAVKKNGTIDAYKGFLAEYPNSPYTKEILDTIETRRYNEAIQSNDSALWSAFIKDFPQSSRVQEFEAKLNALVPDYFIYRYSASANNVGYSLVLNKSERYAHDRYYAVSLNCSDQQLPLTGFVLGVKNDSLVKINCKSGRFQTKDFHTIEMTRINLKGLHAKIIDPLGKILFEGEMTRVSGDFELNEKSYNGIFSDKATSAVYGQSSSLEAIQIASATQAAKAQSIQRILDFDYAGEKPMDIQSFMNSWKNYDYSSSADVQCWSDSILVIHREMSFVAEGMSHDQMGEGYINIDLMSGVKIEMFHIFSPSGIDQLLPVLKEKIYKKYQLTEDSMFPFKAPNQFALYQDGILFHYNPYEIASFSNLFQDYFIAYKDLKPYLNLNHPFVKTKLGL